MHAGIKKTMKSVNVAHILGGIVLLVVLKKFFSNEFVQSKWWLFVVLGLMIGAYHVSKYLKNTKRWIYLFHVLFVAPTIFSLGIYPVQAREILQLIACAMIAYHAAILAGVV
jgi:uncharacterized membrane protein AbrB (regulator of aidB expression)